MPLSAFQYHRRVLSGFVSATRCPFCVRYPYSLGSAKFCTFLLCLHHHHRFYVLLLLCIDLGFIYLVADIVFQLSHIVQPFTAIHQWQHRHLCVVFVLIVLTNIFDAINVTKGKVGFACVCFIWFVCSYSLLLYQVPLNETHLGDS